jgi:hypothetical protein
MNLNKLLTLGLLKFDESQLPSFLKFLKEREYESLEHNKKSKENF